jgi:glycogen operon protein
VVSHVKVNAGTGDLAAGGYQVGNFPPLWSEWNGQYRDVVRDYWRGEPETLGEFAARITGSSDLYQDDGRKPSASVNFVVAHDGFTLRDLVSYNDKHNAANGEDNRDGESHNRSWNCGREGETDDPDVLALRNRQQRNFLTTLLLSQGVPMLAHGDELGRTQQGNNNVYCQNNELSWIDWGSVDTELLAFTRMLTELRAEHPVFRRRRFFDGHGSGPDDPVGDIVWLRPDGTIMTAEDWDTGYARSLAAFLNGDAIRDPGPRGEQIVDDSFLLLFHAGHEDLVFTIPPAWLGEAWAFVLDTADPDVTDRTPLGADEKVTLIARSVVVLRRL